MTTQQELRQASVRAATGTTECYEGDWHALFTLEGIAAGQFSERMLLWINATLDASYTNLNDAYAAFASNQGADTFSAIGTMTLLSNERATEDGAIRVTESGSIRIIE